MVVIESQNTRLNGISSRRSIVLPVRHWGHITKWSQMVRIAPWLIVRMLYLDFRRGHPTLFGFLLTIPMGIRVFPVALRICLKSLRLNPPLLQKFLLCPLTMTRLM